MRVHRAARRHGARALLDFVVLLMAALLVSEAALLSFHSYAYAATGADETVAVHGSQPFATLLCRFADVPTEPLDAAYFDALLSNTAPGLGDYWREVSYGAIDLAGSRAGGWYVLPGTRETYRQIDGPTGANLDLMAADCVAAADADFDFSRYSDINLVFNACIDRPRGGLVDLQLEGKLRRVGVTWLCTDLASSQNTVAHEMGHAFGMQHSAAGHEQEYGNVWDVMSTAFACQYDSRYGAIAQHPSAYHKDLLGWLPPERKFVATPNSVTTITLERLAQPPLAEGAYLMAEIPIPGPDGGYYTVEARMRAGYDRSLPTDSVVIHEVNPMWTPSTLRLVNHRNDDDMRVAASVWPAGTTFVDQKHGIAVTVDEQTATGFVVTIYTRPATRVEQATLPGWALKAWAGPSDEVAGLLEACVS